MAHSSTSVQVLPSPLKPSAHEQVPSLEQSALGSQTRQGSSPEEVEVEVSVLLALGSVVEAPVVVPLLSLLVSS